MTEPQRNPGRVLSFTGHLEELRVRIIICLVFFCFAILIGLYWAPPAVAILIRPLTSIPDTAASSPVVLERQADGTLTLGASSTSSGTEGTTATADLRSLLGTASRHGLAIDLGDGGEPLRIGSRSPSNLFFLSPIEPFMLLLKAALLIACMLTIPLVVYQAWLFIAPGLLIKERRIVKPILLSSLFLFPAGVAFAYFISHFALMMLLSFADMVPGLTPNITASQYLSFIMTLMLVFGVVFEFPLVLVLLATLGIISSSFLRTQRRYAIFIIAIVSALVTPPDPFTMLAMVLPLVLLYEASVWVIRLLEASGASGTTAD